MDWSQFYYTLTPLLPSRPYIERFLFDCHEQWTTLIEIAVGSFRPPALLACEKNVSFSNNIKIKHNINDKRGSLIVNKNMI